MKVCVSGRIESLTYPARPPQEGFRIAGFMSRMLTVRRTESRTRSCANKEQGTVSGGSWGGSGSGEGWEVGNGKGGKAKK